MSKENKDKKFVNEVLQVLTEKYDNNLLNYSEAEKEVKFKYQVLNKLNLLDNKLKNKVVPLVSNDRYTLLDFKNNEINTIETDEPLPLLAYNIDYLSVRRSLPMGLTSFFNIEMGKDKSKYGNNDETQQIFDWVKARVFGIQYNINTISLDKKTGVFRFNTSFMEPQVGTSYQFMTCRLDLNKVQNVFNNDKKVKDWIKDSNTMLAYFMMFGATEIYTRCTCQDYYNKFNKKPLGASNFMCKHIFYNIQSMPYYLMYTLE